MLSRLRRWRAARFDARHPFPADTWAGARARLPLLARVPEASAQRLGQRAWRFLHDKRLSLHPDLDPAALDSEERLALAAQACLLTLGWSDHEHQDAFANVHEVLVLPEAFRRQVEEMDEAGVMHVYEDERAGETFYQGPVVIALPDLLESGGLEGFNVVIHEFAHKLDMGNSQDVDGFPPLPVTIASAQWHREFSAVWSDLQERVASGEPTPIDDYAATHPGECFAVCCETFFSAPDLLSQAYSGLYELLCRYFKQQPHQWHLPTAALDAPSSDSQARSS
ncbi:zinc-dependent peptidase [Halomonas cupida]|uniref:M90 family metallopeptidase n=1 Tax=Halomonas TaxID=2745 RepID=UPI001C99650E|nr:M90 family metallopeptidase [Halomonas sp. DP5Y7-2]MBY5982926.1 zinc-dependent peptidase [Halomonas sp. DP5Y7-2]